MQEKIYSIFVGYDRRVTEYRSGEKGKFPTKSVENWLTENVGVNGWQYDWEPPIDPVVKNADTTINDYTELNSNYGATFYFESAEDRLIFCMTWLSDKYVPLDNVFDL